MSLIEAPWSLQGTSKHFLSDCWLGAETITQRSWGGSKLTLGWTAEVRGHVSSSRPISRTLGAKWSDCVLTTRQAAACAAYTTQDGTNHSLGQSLLGFWNLSPKCCFFITFLLLLLFLLLKSISGGWKLSVHFSSSSNGTSNSERKRTHIMKKSVFKEAVKLENS